MNRRSWFQSLTALFATASAEQPKPEPCITPAYAGFDGSYFMNPSAYKIILYRCRVDSPNRYTGLPANVMAVWKNHDGSVSKLLYRNRDGKLFDLQFVPMEEPT